MFAVTPPVRVAVKVNGTEPPALNEAGLNPVIWSVTAKLIAFELLPSAFCTVTAKLPALASKFAGIDAVRLDGLL